MSTLLVACNESLRIAIEAIRADLDVGAGLRLFSNFFDPGPGDAALLFQECSFPGYARWNLAGAFSPALKAQDGEYAIRSIEHTFTCTGASTQTAYGWFIVKDNKVRFAKQFQNPVVLGLNVDVPVKILLESFALSLIASIS